MLKRKITDKLLAWKKQDGSMCLLLEGARQVGKTYVVNEFGRREYRHFVSLNFEENPAYRQVFDGSLEVDELIAQLSLVVPGARFVPGETLIFLDEIQSCPNARTALKFFSLDGRFDVIASGSLLGIGYAEVSSFPVGYVERLTMYGLDFEEYLWARGVAPEAVEMLRGYFDRAETVPSAVHDRMMGLFREYMAVGGMPRAVQRFVDTRNFDEVLRIQRGIVADYQDDIAKYARDTEKAKARACFLSIPRQLARDYKKFSYAVVEKGSGARKYAGSLQWLYDAGIVDFCHNLERPERPFEGNVRAGAFKVYMRDTGLLVSMLEDGAQRDVVNGDLGIYKGALYENIVADVFGKLGKKLYYFEKNSKLEVDFLIRFGDKTTAVEVKSSMNRKSKSMDSLIENYGVPQGIKLAPSNMGRQGDEVRVVPLYMAMFL